MVCIPLNESQLQATTFEVAGSSSSQKAPEHFNSTGCCIRYSDGKGRGVFASREIPARTVIEISPVLLFSNTEYQEHGRHTILDHYTFKWRDGKMALALGLGSLFNHSQTPNISYTLDSGTESIRYTTTRTIQADEELCIFYAHKLWFEPEERTATYPHDEKDGDGWGGLLYVQDDTDSLEDDETWSVLQGGSDDIVPEEELPFARLKLVDDEEEDILSSVRTEQVWVVDIPEPRHITTMLKWLKQTGLDTPALSHLKRIRKTGTTSTILLAPVVNSPKAPELPQHLDLPQPYVVDVPRSVALTPTSLKLKSTFWPTIFAPRKKGELEQWSRGRVSWAWEAMRNVVKEAQVTGEKGELPIVAYVPEPYDEATKISTQLRRSFIAHDTRQSAFHPLRHAVLNVVRMVADYRALPISETLAEDVPVPTPPIEMPVPPLDVVNGDDTSAARNGSHYLLTALTLFISHEPCIMCTMALLHSRVKEIIYLVPMEKTGGCGGITCVPKLEGVNHRFGISRWKTEALGIKSNLLEVDTSIDA